MFHHVKIYVISFLVFSPVAFGEPSQTLDQVTFLEPGPTTIPEAVIQAFDEGIGYRGLLKASAFEDQPQLRNQATSLGMISWYERLYFYPTEEVAWAEILKAPDMAAFNLGAISSTDLNQLKMADSSSLDIVIREVAQKPGEVFWFEHIDTELQKERVKEVLADPLLEVREKSLPVSTNRGTRSKKYLIVKRNVGNIFDYFRSDNSNLRIRSESKSLGTTQQYLEIAGKAFPKFRGIISTDRFGPTGDQNSSKDFRTYLSQARRLVHQKNYEFRIYNANTATTFDKQRDFGEVLSQIVNQERSGARVGENRHKDEQVRNEMLEEFNAGRVLIISMRDGKGVLRGSVPVMLKERAVEPETVSYKRFTAEEIERIRTQEQGEREIWNQTHLNSDPYVSEPMNINVAKILGGVVTHYMRTRLNIEFLDAVMVTEFSGPSLFAEYIPARDFLKLTTRAAPVDWSTYQFEGTWIPPAADEIAHKKPVGSKKVPSELSSALRALSNAFPNGLGVEFEFQLTGSKLDLRIDTGSAELESASVLELLESELRDATEKEIAKMEREVGVPIEAGQGKYQMALKNSLKVEPAKLELNFKRRR